MAALIDPPLPLTRGASFPEPVMRSALYRYWNDALPMGAFVGANPGKADAFVDDATARKYVGFARRWGWGGYVALNLFEWVATDMKELIARILAGEPVHAKDPNAAFRSLPAAAVKVVCLAWGRTPPPIRGAWESRVMAIRRILIEELSPTGMKIVIAARNLDGSPAHLSRLPYTESPLPIF